MRSGGMRRTKSTSSGSKYGDCHDALVAVFQQATRALILEPGGVASRLVGVAACDDKLLAKRIAHPSVRRTRQPGEAPAIEARSPTRSPPLRRASSKNGAHDEIHHA